MLASSIGLCGAQELRPCGESLVTPGLRPWARVSGLFWYLHSYSCGTGPGSLQLVLAADLTEGICLQHRLGPLRGAHTFASVSPTHFC